jgi:hypothetical protein
MSESTLSFNFKSLYQDVLNYMGQDRDTTDADLLAKAKRRVNEAYRSFLALDWSFLGKHAVLQLDAGKDTYELPDDYGIIRTGFKLFPYMGWANPIETTVSQFWSYQSFYPRTGIPLFYTFHTEFAPAKGLRYTVMFYPKPHVSLTYNYEYRIYTSALVDDDEIPYCPASLSHVLRAFCLAEVEMFDEEGAKTAWTNKLYNVFLPQAIKENSIRSPNSVGSMNENAGMFSANLPTIHSRFGNTISFEGGSPYAM